MSQNQSIAPPAPPAPPPAWAVPTVILKREGEVSLGTGVSLLPLLTLAPQLTPFTDAVTSLEAQAEVAIIDSVEKYQVGSDFLSYCDINWKRLEELRKDVKTPADEYCRLVQQFFVPLQSRFKNASAKVSEKMRAFKKAQEQRLAEEQERIRQQNEAVALQLAEESQAAGDIKGANALLEVATLMPTPVVAPRIGVRNSFGRSTHTRKRWTARVVEPMEVLKAIVAGKLSIDLIEGWSQQKLNELASKLKVEQTINGVRIYQDENLQQR